MMPVRERAERPRDLDEQPHPKPVAPLSAITALRLSKAVPAMSRCAHGT